MNRVWEWRRRRARWRSAKASRNGVYQALIGRTDIAIVVHGGAGTIIDANQAFADLLGYRLEEVPGLSSRDVVHPDDIPMRDAQAAELLAGNQHDLVTTRRLMRKDGSQIRARVRKTAADLRGEPVVMVMIEEWSTITDLEHDAAYDPLTHLLNRRGLKTRLAVSYPTTELHLAMVDVDDLKLTNDRYGHHSGDLLLTGIARSLTEAAGEGGVVARWAGDEFVVCVPSESVSREELSAALDAGIAGALDAQGTPVSVTPSASLGITLFDPVREEIDVALRRADAAMYHAKRGGLDR